MTRLLAVIGFLAVVSATAADDPVVSQKKDKPDREYAEKLICKLGGRILPDRVDPDDRTRTLVKIDLTFRSELLDEDLAQLEAFDVDLVNLQLTSSPATDAGMKHLGCLSRLQELSLGNTKVTDEGLKQLAGLTKLTRLDLSNTKVTDEGLKQLSKLTQLEALSLGGAKPQVTDAGLKHLAALPQLETLDLIGATGITDAGLDDLAQMSQLKMLVILGTSITPEGKLKLQKVLRKTKIVG